MLRGGGDSAYVFDESIDAQGLLQERRPLLGRAYTSLVHADVLPRARLALEAAGASGFRVSDGPAPGWLWRRTSCSPGSSRPHSPTCGWCLADVSPQARLSGGCESARPRTSPWGAYVLLPPGSGPYALRSTARRDVTTRQMTTWSTCPRTFQPADIRFSSRTTGRLPRGTADARRPEATRLGYALDDATGRPLVFGSSAGPLAPGQDGVIGARVRGLDGDPMLLVRVWPGQQVLVLTKTARSSRCFLTCRAGCWRQGLSHDGERRSRPARSPRNRGVRPCAYTGHGQGGGG